MVQKYADVNWRITHSEKIELSLCIDDERDSVTTECTLAHPEKYQSLRIRVNTLEELLF